MSLKNPLERYLFPFTNGLQKEFDVSTSRGPISNIDPNSLKDVRKFFLFDRNPIYYRAMEFDKISVPYFIDVIGNPVQTKLFSRHYILPNTFRALNFGVEDLISARRIGVTKRLVSKGVFIVRNRRIVDYVSPFGAKVIKCLYDQTS